MTKVLLVSADRDVSTLVFETLIYNGFTVERACESTAACKHLREIRFDFIIMDLELKHESGLALYKSLRTLGNSIPVIMLGEGKLDQFLLEDMEDENFDFLLRPIRFHELQFKINHFLNLKTLSESEIGRARSSYVDQKHLSHESRARSGGGLA